MHMKKKFASQLSMQKKGKKTLLLYSIHAKKKETETQSTKKKEKRNSANEKTEIQSTEKKKTDTANTHTEEKKLRLQSVSVSGAMVGLDTE